MIRLIVASAAAIGIILLVAFVAARLVRSRSQGISIRMQMFLALAGIVGAFAFGLGLVVIDRIEARATLLAEGAASDEAAAIATLLASELDRDRASRPAPRPGAAEHDPGEQTLEQLATRISRARLRGTPELHLAIIDPSGRELLAEGPRAGEPGHVFMTAEIVVQDKVVGSVRVGKPTIKIRQVLTDIGPAVLVASAVLVVPPAPPPAVAVTPPAPPAPPPPSVEPLWFLLAEHPTSATRVKTSALRMRASYSNPPSRRGRRRAGARRHAAGSVTRERAVRPRGASRGARPPAGRPTRASRSPSAPPRWRGRSRGRGRSRPCPRAS